MAKPRVVITGMGSISPHGKGVDALWDGLIKGKAAFTAITLFDASSFRNPLAGEVSGYSYSQEKGTRALQMVSDACEEAVADAFGYQGANGSVGIPPTYGARIAIVTGTNFGGMSAAERGLFAGVEDPKEEASLDAYLFGNAGDAIGHRFGIQGPRFNLSLSCASGTAAIGLGFDLIRLGRVDSALICGYDELSLFIFAGLSALRAITKETVRPFDKRRKGTLFSEGAGTLFLERADLAEERGAKIYVEVLGRAVNNDGYHMTAPETEATGIRKLMRAALKDAGCEPDQIDHVNLHATGTPYNDKIETKALHDVFGARTVEIPVCSVKSSIGHTMGAAGMHETIAAVRTIQCGEVPPVLGLDPAEQDPECNLRAPTGKPLAGSYNTVLKTSYGFGGTNAALVLGAT